MLLHTKLRLNIALICNELLNVMFWTTSNVEFAVKLCILYDICIGGEM